MAFVQGVGAEGDRDGTCVVDVILDVDEGVSGYRTGDGGFELAFGDQSLQVYRLIGSDGRPVADPDSPQAFVRCGQWTYPLVPGRTPVLRHKYRFYVFPDAATIETDEQSADEGDGAEHARAAIAAHATSLIFSFSVPDAEVDLFENILCTYADIRLSADVDEEWVVLEEGVAAAAASAAEQHEAAAQQPSTLSATAATAFEMSRRAATALVTSATVASSLARDAALSYRAGDWTSFGAEERVIATVGPVTCFRVSEGNTTETIHRGDVSLVDRVYSAWLVMGPTIVALPHVTAIDRTSAGGLQITALVGKQTLRYLLAFGDPAACDGFADALKREASVRRPSVSDRMSQGLETASEWLSLNVARGTESAAEAIRRGGHMLKARVAPLGKADVSPAMENRLRTVKDVTSKATYVSARVAQAVHTAASAIIRAVSAPIVAAAARRLDGDSSQGAMSVLGTGARGAVVVYAGLEASAKRLAGELSATLSDVVGHVYGEDAGRAAELALDSAGNIGSAYMNVSRAGLRVAIRHGTARAVFDSALAVRDDPQRTTHAREKADSEQEAADLVGGWPSVQTGYAQPPTYEQAVVSGVTPQRQGVACAPSDPLYDWSVFNDKTQHSEE
eukprot:Opistho-1_new@62015